MAGTSGKQSTFNVKDPHTAPGIQELILHAPMGICVLDASTLVGEIVNDPFIEISGKSREAIEGKYYWDAFSEAREYYEDALKQVVAEGVAYYANEVKLMLLRRGMQEEIYVTFAYIPHKDQSGNVTKVIVYVLENTAQVATRKKIEEEVVQRTQELDTAHQETLALNNYLQEVINVFKTPLQVLDPVFENGEIVDFKFSLTNNAYASYANTMPGKLQGKKVSEVFPGYLQTSSFTNVVDTFNTGLTKTWEIHYNVDGLDLYNEMTATRLGTQVVLEFTDFTKLKHLQLELIRKIDELERSNRNLEEFAHAASHDLKEPIRKINVFTSRLKDLVPDRSKQAEETFAKIENATERMGLLVDDLLVYSHVTELPTEKETIDLNKKVQTVLEDLELIIQEKNALVNVSELPKLKGYPRQLQQMFQNIISNALKYSKADVAPRIEIHAGIQQEKGKRYHVIEIKDNGIGFEQKHAERIFKMFTRLHGKAEYNGTGIGLSIVKKVVENHEGMVTAESAPGQGTSFKIYLPAENN